MTLADPLFYTCEDFENGGTLFAGTPLVPPETGLEYFWVGVTPDGFGNDVELWNEGDVSEVVKPVYDGSYSARINPSALNRPIFLLADVGFFKLEWNGSQTASFDSTVTASDLQTALRTLTGDSGLTVTGPASVGPWFITFSAPNSHPIIFIDDARNSSCLGTLGGWAAIGRNHLVYDIDRVLLSSTSPNPVIWSLYFQFKSLPDSDCWLFSEECVNSGGVRSDFMGVGFNSQTGALRPFHFGSFEELGLGFGPHTAWGPDGIKPVIGRWYLLDMRLAIMPGIVEWEIDAVVQPTWGSSVTSSSRTRRSWLGNVSNFQLDDFSNSGTTAETFANTSDYSSSYDMYVDDWVVVKELAGDWVSYPIGDHSNNCTSPGTFFLPNPRERQSVYEDQLLTGGNA